MNIPHPRFFAILSTTVLLAGCHVGTVSSAAVMPPVTAAAKASPAAGKEAIRYKQQSMSVKDVDRSAAFYTRHFGYTITQRATFPELTLVVLERQDHRLQLMSGGAVASLDWRQSMGFFVRDFDRMAKAVPLLKPPFQLSPDGPRILFAKDPDGYPVEVIEDLPAR